jgi:hypothetical protein
MLEGQAELQSECPPAAGAREECFVASALWHKDCAAHWTVLPQADNELNTRFSLKFDSTPTTFFASELAYTSMSYATRRDAFKRPLVR